MVVTRFLQEAKAVNVIDHPNIINVYDYGEAPGGDVYFVMEFLEGKTLDDVMIERGPLPVPLLLHAFGQTAKALAAAHSKQIVHRDLKPANVFVIAREDNPFFIKLLDFGIAQLRGDGEVKGLTVAGTVMGTPDYMSPEQVSGVPIDARTDVWSMGVMMYRAATGRMPFEGEGFAALAAQILTDNAPPPRQLNPTIPAELEQLIQRCMERNLPDRCQSMSELQNGLERVKVALKLDDAKVVAEVRKLVGDKAPPSPSRAAPAQPVEKATIKDAPAIGTAATEPSVPAKPASPAAAAAPAAKSRAPIIAGAIVGVALIGGGAAFMLTRGGSKPAQNTVAVGSGFSETPSDGGSAAPVKAEGSIKDAFAANDTALMRTRAANQLKNTLTAANLQEQGQAVDALAAVRDGKTATLLYAALGGGPEVRVKAARALGGLGLPDSVPKLREALAQSGDKVKVEIAAALVRLGDKDAIAILKRALSDPGMRLTAATALAEINDKAAQPVLAEIVEATPVGRDQWLRAAQGLVRLGDDKAKKAIEAELAQADAARAVAAADVLVTAGDAKAKDYLVRVMGDASFVQRGRAAAAVAGTRDPRALEWVPTGLASSDTEERTLAIAICGLLDTTNHDRELAALATDDPDRGVRLTAAAALL